MENAIKAACLAIFAEFRANIENGRITNTQEVLTEVTNCMVQVQHLAEPAPPSPPAVKPEEMSNIHVCLTDLQGKMVDFEDALSVLRTQTSNETAKLIEEQKDNTKTILAAVENVMTSRAPASTAQSAPPNSAPSTANSNPAITTSPSASRSATVLFPGGPRTITVHPPGTPGYQSLIRDDRGDVIIDFRRRQPLRREGAFRGLPDETDYTQMKHVGGRGPQPAKKPVPPVPRWPDQDSPCPSRRSRGPSELIARQRQLAESMETDEYGRVIPPKYAGQLKVPGASADTSSSPSSQESQESSSSNVEGGGVSTPSSATPPSSPSSGMSKKRARASEDAETGGLQSTPGDEKPASSVNETLETPASVKREESNPAEGPAKRRKLHSASLKRSVSTRSISRAHSMADVTRGS